MLRMLWIYLIMIACNDIKNIENNDNIKPAPVHQPTYHYLTNQDLDYIDVMVSHDDADIVIIYVENRKKELVKELKQVFRLKRATIVMQPVKQVQIQIDEHIRSQNLHIQYLGDYKYEVRVLD